MRYLHVDVLTYMSMKSVGPTLRREIIVPHRGLGCPPSESQLRDIIPVMLLLRSLNVIIARGLINFYGKKMALFELACPSCSSDSDPEVRV